MTSSSAPTSAAAVANAFLDLQAADSGNFPRIDQMKLYKLVFYAQAWWLAQKDTPLFEEDVYAWPWGPVVREIYGDFKSAGRDPITHQRATTITKTGTSLLDFRISKPQPPNEEVMSFLKQTWDVHKPFTGIALSNATHAPGEPWTIIKDLHDGDLSDKPLIPVEVIRDVFKGKLVASRQA
ncbi:Panacea domain-containing protein [Xinfangfangia pollutisoli]|uniref:Panacea domain-containing protein n=1 Tax=Xinfangfangia pollutisoli TaxID=2865960 RepID=UPI001CD6ECBB|nr:type II toxin-antitoxin system antitoxin SocA domain-containing protein [Xinfangfangia pollutisoli]